MKHLAQNGRSLSQQFDWGKSCQSLEQIIKNHIPEKTCHEQSHKDPK